MLYPLTFHPIFKERVWGGRRLESLYGKRLPPDATVGESWEITDRPEGVSVIANGPLAGRTLRWLMEEHAAELLGAARALGGRFPLLVKILDAQDKLSLQVHPPAALAAFLGGEPKTEMWYITDATPDAALFVGLKRGVTRAQFEARVADGTVAECFHRVNVRAGDAMFLPSGRVHAIGAGSVLFEIQQNSDTTYRVFDWNRVGLDGRPRELHVAPSLASIDFTDFEPALLRAEPSSAAADACRTLVNDPLFRVEVGELAAGKSVRCATPSVVVLGVIHGELVVRHAAGDARLCAGDFCLLPASLGEVTLHAPAGARFLHAQPGC